jgi:putative ABC transport system permease protein
VLAATLSVLPTLRTRGSRDAFPSRGRSVEPSGGTLRRGLVIAEVAVAVTLLIGAGLSLNSFARLRGTDLGFTPAGLVAMKLDVPADGYTAEQRGVLARELEEAVESVSGVTDGYIWSPQVPGQSAWYTAIRPQDRPELRDDELPVVRFHYVGPGALEGVGMRFVAGRGISALDTFDGNGAVVLSESAARAMWPEGGDPVGKVMRRWNRERWLTVVGVTEDARLSGRQGPGTGDNMDVYFSFQQEPQNNLVVLARARGDAGAAIEPVRAAVQAVAPGLPAFDADTLAARVAQQEAIPRFTAMLAAFFAGTAVSLASIGLYGLLAYSVCLRTREIGLRVALGAQPGRIMRDVVQQGVRLALVGVVLGAAAALALTRWIEALLFDVHPGDPATFIGAALLLLLVAASASFIPARRALRVDPQQALRSD